MSIKTWKKKFVHLSIRSEMQLLHDALRKWEGLRNTELASYHCRKMSGLPTITDGSGMLRIGSANCGLCLKHTDSCHYCPLLGACENEKGRPWYEWIVSDDPEPMIKRIKELI